jgi:DNA-binding NarL/FixJ family response regulator
MRATRFDVVGRARELAQLDELVADVAGGLGRIGWIQGEPGIGKSALMDMVAGGGRDARSMVFRGNGDELMTAFPLRLMADCLGVSTRSNDAARVEIASLLRGDTTGIGGTIDPVLAAGERILDLVDRLAVVGPLTLILEDLQWADEPSLLLWNRLTRVVDQIPLLLLGTCRPVPFRPTVDRLRAGVQDRDGLIIDLGPFTAAEVIEMTTHLAGAQPGPGLSAELARAGGNPLYVRELVHALLLDRMVEVAADVAELNAPSGATPGSLPAAIARRLSFLSPAAGPVLRWAALLGNEFQGGELAAVTGNTAAELADITTEAVTAGVIVDTGAGFRFRHDLIRQALAEQIPGAMRGALHAQIARSLAEAGFGVDKVARHLLAVADGLDPWALRWLADSSESMLYAAPEISTDLLTRVLPLLPEDDPQWEKLLARLVQMLFWMGRNEQLDEVAASALHRFTDPELTARSRIHWARSVMRIGRFEEAFAALEPLLQNASTPEVWRNRAAAWASCALISNRQADEGHALALETLDRALRDGDPLSIAYARIALTQVSDATTQIALYDEVLAGLVDDDPDSTDIRMAAMGNRATPLFYLGRATEAQDAIRAATIMAERSGSFRTVTFAALATEFAFDIGHWDEVLVNVAGIAPELLESQSFMHLRGIVAVVALHREDREMAIAQLRAAGIDDFTAATSQGMGRGGHLTPALAMLAEAEGNVDRVLSIQRTWLDLDAYHRFFRQFEASALVRTALAAGDRATAEATAAAAAEDPLSAVPAQLLAARTCQAMLSDDTAELLTVAAEHAQAGFVEQASFNYEEAAVRLAASGDIAAARKAFTEAVQIYAELGATWDMRRADARLRPFGIRRGSRSLHRREKTGWNALTPTETRIAGLVALGKSNPDISAELFISRNTVQTHMSNILGKLQLRSRIDLVRQATAQLPVLDARA